MNRKKLRVLMVSMAMAMTLNSFSTVFAKVDVNTSANKGNITINGTSDHNGQPVTIKTWTGDSEENPEKRYYIDQENTDESGSFNFNFKVDENKEYHGKVNVGGESKTFDFSTKEKPAEEKTLREKVEEARDAAADVVWQTNYKYDWAALGLARAGREVPSEYISSVGTNFGKITDCETAIIGIVSAGGNPLDFKGQNLIEKIYNGEVDKQGINAVIYALISVDTGKYTIPANAKWNREKMINYILERQLSDNGWAMSENKGDADITGMVMAALAPYYKSNAKVKTAIDSAVEFLSNTQNENGGFNSYGSESSESIAQAIVGLCANGIDPISEKFTKNGHNPIDALISYKTEDGFCHVKDYGGTTNGMATEQALYALDQYVYFLDKKGSIYDFGDKNADTPDKIKPTIVVDGIEKDSTVNKSQIEFGVTATDNKDGEVTPVVKLGETTINVEDGKYKANLLQGENIITIEATDAAGNKVIETYTLTYEKPIFTIKRVGEGNFKNDTDAELKISITNNTNENQKATFIVALYTDNEQKMVDWTYLNKTIKAGETEQLAGGFTIPKSGKYKVKGMVWESRDNITPKASEIVVISE